jgi:hypothetical protein
MEHVKVRNTEIHKTSQGDHLVCRGRLILARDGGAPHDGDLAWSESMGHFVYQGPATNYASRVCRVIAAVVSDAEAIRAGELMYVEGGVSKIERAGWDMAPCGTCQKVLALGKNLSERHVEAICAGTLRHGDLVMVKCDRKYLTPTGDVVDYQYDDETPIGVVRLDACDHIRMFRTSQAAASESDAAWELYGMLDGMGRDLDPYDYGLPADTAEKTRIVGEMLKRFDVTRKK